MLITERSFVGWAEKLALELNEPLPEIVHMLGLALINKELRAFFAFFPGHELDLAGEAAANPGMAWDTLVQTLPLINNRAIFEWSYLGIGHDETPLRDALEAFIIKDADMTRWRESRDGVPQSSGKTARVKSWIATQYPDGIPAGKGPKQLRREFHDAAGIDVSASTVRVALGRK
jgi:hypothetical protein